MPKAAAEMAEEPELCSRPATGVLHGADGASSEIRWQLPEEVPVALQINSEPYTVMMATPADLEDFAIGFVLSEGLVAHAADIANVLAFRSGGGFTADVAVPEGKLIRERMVARSLEGRVGCGLCGIAEMEDAIRMPEGKLKSRPLMPTAVARAFEALPSFQPMNAVNRTVHAAAWCGSDGSILLAREDVGRHNALDKLAGALLRGPDAGLIGQGAVVLTSRISVDLVQKTATLGAPVLIALAPPASPSSATDLSLIPISEPTRPY